MNKYKVVCLDLMETIVGRNDSELYRKIEEIISDATVSADYIGNITRQKYLEYSMGNYCDDREYVWVLLTTLLGKEPSDEMICSVTEKLLDHYYPIEGSLDFMSTLKRGGYRLIVASNFVSSWAQALLTQFEFSEWVDGVLISSDICCRKPAAHFFDCLVEMCNAKRNEVLFVGNSFCNDYLGAKRAGMDAILLKENNVCGEGFQYDAIIRAI